MCAICISPPTWCGHRDRELSPLPSLLAAQHHNNWAATTSCKQQDARNMNAGKTQVFFFFSFTHRIREVRFHTPLRNKGLFFFFASSKMLQCAEIEVSKNCMRSQVIHSHSQHDYAVEGTFEHVTFFNACNGAVELTVTMGTNRRKTTRKWVQLTQVRKHIPSSEKSTFFLFLSLGKSNSIKHHF